MRKDPPFDIEYVTTTWLLSRAEIEGARIFNRPQALRDHSEKLSVMEFSQFSVPTLVARDAGQIQAFIDAARRHPSSKPLDGMGGSQIFRVRDGDPNRNVIIETVMHEGERTIMAQRYIPEISDGDKRILIVGGELVPYCLARIPKAGETRGNLAAGGTGVARELSARDREIGETLAPVLAARGLFLVGIDVIGDYLTEINVTQPDLHGRNRDADRLRRGADVHHRARARMRANEFLAGFSAPYQKLWHLDFRWFVGVVTRFCRLSVVACYSSACQINGSKARGVR